MKVGLNQINKPAPVWFRRLRDASVNFLLPALGQLVTSLNLTDEKENLWLQVLTFLPAAFNFVGVLLGEDVKSRVKTYTWLLLPILLLSCKSPQKLAAERSQQERDLLRSLHGRYADSTILAFPLTLPGGMVTVTQQAPCPDFDSGSVKSSRGVLTVTAPCPDKTVNADSIIRNSPAYIAAMAGRALAEARADSLKVVTVQQDVKLDRQAAQLKWFYSISAALIGFGALWLVFGGKLSLIKSLFK